MCVMREKKESAVLQNAPWSVSKVGESKAVLSNRECLVRIRRCYRGVNPEIEKIDPHAELL